MGGRNGVVRLGGQHRSSSNCEYKGLGFCWRELERMSSLILCKDYRSGSQTGRSVSCTLHGHRGTPDSVGNPYQEDGFVYKVAGAASRMDSVRWSGACLRGARGVRGVL
jgi:hypothetical protein